MITLDEARRLYGQYMAGGLSQAGLRRLAAFIQSPACPEEWRKERGLFAALQGTLPAASPRAGFESRLAERMRLAVQASDAPDSPAPGRKAGALRRRSQVWKLRGAAALALAACLAAAVWLGLGLATRESADVSLSMARIVQTKEAMPPVAEGALKDSVPDAGVESSVAACVRTSGTGAVRKRRRTVHEVQAESQRADSSIYTPTATSPEEVERQMRLIAALLGEARNATKLDGPVMMAMDWKEWKAAGRDLGAAETN